MSYILEALKRSEQERHQGELAHATIDTIMVPAKQVRHHWWPYLLIALLLVNLLVYLYFKLSSVDAEPETKEFVAEQQEVAAKELPVQSSRHGHGDSLSELPVAQNEKPLPAHLSKTPKLTKRYDVNQYSRQSKQIAAPPVQVPVRKNINADGLEVIRPKQGAKKISSEALMAHQDKLEGDAEKSTYLRERSEPVLEQEVLPELKLENFDDIEHLSDLDVGFQKGIPSISFNSHIYSTNPADRRVMLNNLYLREGQGFSGMTIETIGEFYVVLTKGEQRFKLPVLRDWFKPD